MGASKYSANLTKQKFNLKTIIAFQIKVKNEQRKVLLTLE